MRLTVPLNNIFLAMLMLAPILAHASVFSDKIPPYVHSPNANPFAPTYLSLELGRNYPLAFSQNSFDTGPEHPLIGYRYTLDESWLMGIGLQFKIMSRRDKSESRELALWTIIHESLFSIRLDHPIYLLVGPKILYLLPAKTATIPLDRDNKFPVEIGAGLSASFAYVSDSWMLTLRADRWRGTSTSKLQGLELAFGISFALSRHSQN